MERGSWVEQNRRLRHSKKKCERCGKQARVKDYLYCGKCLGILKREMNQRGYFQPISRPELLGEGEC